MEKWRETLLFTIVLEYGTCYNQSDMNEIYQCYCVGGCEEGVKTRYIFIEEKYND